MFCYLVQANKSDSFKNVYNNFLCQANVRYLESVIEFELMGNDGAIEKVKWIANDRSILPGIRVGNHTNKIYCPSGGTYKLDQDYHVYCTTHGFLKKNIMTHNEIEKIKKNILYYEFASRLFFALSIAFIAIDLKRKFR